MSPRKPPTRRRPTAPRRVALPLAVAILLILVGCEQAPPGISTSNGGPAAAAASASPSSPGIAAPRPAQDMPTVRDEPGIVGPVITFPAAGPPADPQRTRLRQGTGPAVRSTDWIAVNYQARVWNGATVATTYDRDLPAVLKLANLIPGWTTGLAGVPVGSRVLLSVPPTDGYGFRAPTGVGSKDTVVFVIDILAAFTIDRGGQPDAAPQPAPEGLPTVTGSLGSEPKIVIGDAAAGTEPSTTVLALGSGPPVRITQPGADQILIQYKHVSWAGDLLGNSWPTQQSDGQSAGIRSVPLTDSEPYAGLVGVPIGSRVLVIMPPNQENADQSYSPAGVAVVDLVAQTLDDPTTLTSEGSHG